MRSGNQIQRRLTAPRAADVLGDRPADWQTLDVDAARVPFLAIELRRDDTRFRFFTILASLGTPYDVTRHELRVECFLPADEATGAGPRRLAAGLGEEAGRVPAVRRYLSAPGRRATAPPRNTPGGRSRRP